MSGCANEDLDESNKAMTRVKFNFVVKGFKFVMISCRSKLQNTWTLWVFWDNDKHIPRLTSVLLNWVMEEINILI